MRRSTCHCPAASGMSCLLNFYRAKSNRCKSTHITEPADTNMIELNSICVAETTNSGVVPSRIANRGIETLRCDQLHNFGHYCEDSSRNANWPTDAVSVSPVECACKPRHRLTCSSVVGMVTADGHPAPLYCQSNACLLRWI